MIVPILFCAIIFGGRKSVDGNDEEGKIIRVSRERYGTQYYQLSRK
jgi:hypothetical protein